MMNNFVSNFQCWVDGVTFKFDLNHLLKDSCFYPDGAYEFSVIRYYMGNIYSFIYADPNANSQELLEKAKEVNGYRVIYQKAVKLVVSLIQRQN